MGLFKELILRKKGKGGTPKEVVDKLISYLRQKKKLSTKILEGNITKKRVVKILEQEHSKWINYVKKTKDWNLIKTNLEVMKEKRFPKQTKFQKVVVHVKLHGRKRGFKMWNYHIKNNKVRLKVKRKDGVYQHYWYKLLS